jgi:hypothetical protein
MESPEIILTDPMATDAWIKALARHLVSAVNERLRRGLKKRRARLDRDFGDRRSWCATLPTLAVIEVGPDTRQITRDLVMPPESGY